jgi:hypothetical protein
MDRTTAYLSQLTSIGWLVVALLALLNDFKIAPAIFLGLALLEQVTFFFRERQ